MHVHIPCLLCASLNLLVRDNLSAFLLPLLIIIFSTNYALTNVIPKLNSKVVRLLI